MRILIAEDGCASREMLTMFLERQGYVVVATVDGAEALEAMQRPDAPKLAILDWEMPILDGIEACRRIRKLDDKIPPYIIILTAKTNKKDIRTGLEAGADDYLTKPFDMDELRARIGVGIRMNEMHAKLQNSYLEVEQRVAVRTSELAASNLLLQVEIDERKQAHREIDQILSSISSIIIGINRTGRVVRWNDSAENAFGLSQRMTKGCIFNELPIPWEWAKVIEGVDEALHELKQKRIFNVWYERLDGKDGFFVVTVGLMLDAHGNYDGFLLLGDEISDVKFLEAQLAQTSKLEAIGQLAAGIAHEINTPIQYVSDSINFLKDAFTDLSKAVVLHEKNINNSNIEGSVNTSEMNALLRELDIDFIREELPKTFDRIFDGIERISSIVKAMKRFSYSSGDELKTVNVRDLIENTLIISRNEWKYVADMVTEFDPELPEIMCMPGEFNQVILNIIVNAAHAIGAVVQGTPNKGIITIKTRKCGEFSEIVVKDTGSGIPDNVKPMVFNLFYTTKEVGKGTGQGLAIAYDIVVNKHKGTITFESVVNQGTTFCILLPLGGQSQKPIPRTFS